eukprot:Rmarinus@m.26870
MKRTSVSRRNSTGVTVATYRSLFPGGWITCSKDRAASQIVPGLYVGNASGAKDIKRLRDLGISYICNMSPRQVRTGASFYPSDFVYREYRAQDIYTFDIAPLLEEAVEGIAGALSEGRGVLVHCFVGQSRSTTVACAYLMLHRHMSLAEAAAVVRRGRPMALPNPGFFATLQELDRRRDKEPTQPTTSETSSSMRPPQPASSEGSTMKVRQSATCAGCSSTSEHETADHVTEVRIMT